MILLLHLFLKPKTNQQLEGRIIDDIVRFVTIKKWQKYFPPPLPINVIIIWYFSRHVFSSLYT